MERSMNALRILCWIMIVVCIYYPPTLRMLATSHAFHANSFSVELIVWNASQFILNIQIKKLSMEVDNIIQSKISYILSLSNCDAIFGMSFLNDRKLIIYPEKDIVILDDIEFSLIKDHTMNISISQWSHAVDWRSKSEKMKSSNCILQPRKLQTNPATSHQYTSWSSIESRMNTPTSSSMIYHLICHSKWKIIHEISLYPRFIRINSEESFVYLN